MSAESVSQKPLLDRLWDYVQFKDGPSEGHFLMLEAIREIDRLQSELQELRYAFDTNHDLVPAGEERQHGVAGDFD